MKRVMLVDDAATIRIFVSGILSKAGYAVETTSSALEGLGKLQGGAKADLIITDYSMPGMNGIEFVKEIRKLPDFATTPILFLTTEVQQAMRVEAKEAGATGWLVKPTTSAELLDTVEQVLR